MAKSRTRQGGDTAALVDSLLDEARQRARTGVVLRGELGWSGLGASGGVPEIAALPLPETRVPNAAEGGAGSLTPERYDDVEATQTPELDGGPAGGSVDASPGGPVKVPEPETEGTAGTSPNAEGGTSPGTIAGERALGETGDAASGHELDEDQVVGEQVVEDQPAEDQVVESPKRHWWSRWRREAPEERPAIEMDWERLRSVAVAEPTTIAPRSEGELNLGEVSETRAIPEPVEEDEEARVVRDDVETGVLTDTESWSDAGLSRRERKAMAKAREKAAREARQRAEEAELAALRAASIAVEPAEGPRSVVETRLVYGATGEEEPDEEVDELVLAPEPSPVSYEGLEFIRDDSSNDVVTVYEDVEVAAPVDEKQRERDRVKAERDAARWAKEEEAGRKKLQVDARKKAKADERKYEHDHRVEERERADLVKRARKQQLALAKTQRREQEAQAEKTKRERRRKGDVAPVGEERDFGVYQMPEFLLAGQETLTTLPGHVVPVMDNLESSKAYRRAKRLGLLRESPVEEPVVEAPVREEPFDWAAAGLAEALPDRLANEAMSI